jgi:hypothetical protein
MGAVRYPADVRVGHTRKNLGLAYRVRFTPKNGHLADIPGQPLGAKLGHRRMPMAMLKPALLYSPRYTVSAILNGASFAQKEP